MLPQTTNCIMHITVLDPVRNHNDNGTNYEAAIVWSWLIWINDNDENFTKTKNIQFKVCPKKNFSKYKYSCLWVQFNLCSKQRFALHQNGFLNRCATKKCYGIRLVLKNLKSNLRQKRPKWQNFNYKTLRISIGVTKMRSWFMR